MQEIQELIADAQHDLRSFVQDLRSAPPNVTQADSDLAALLEELSKRIERYWGLRVEWHVGRLQARVSEAMAHEIYRILHEALVNVARHAQASAVRVNLYVQDNQVHITAADNGRGFPFRGYYDHATLMNMNLGPIALRERVASLRGSVAIRSTDRGARLEITLPLVQSGV